MNQNRALALSCAAVLVSILSSVQMGTATDAVRAWAFFGVAVLCVVVALVVAISGIRQYRKEKNR